MTNNGTTHDTDPSTLSRPAWLSAVLSFWIAAAAITGFLHGVELLAARYVFGQLVWFSREFAWMAPVAYALVMAPGALVLAALAVGARRAWTLSFAAAAFVTVGVFGLLLPYSEISRVSSLILALGVGFVVARAVHARPMLWISRSRVAAGLAAAAVLVLAPLQRGLVALRESRQVSGLSGSTGDGTNVLIIILDTVRAASMGLYSSTDSTTPRLNEWSRTATVFDWAFAPAPWTLPSHGSMFTGVTAAEQSGDWERPLDGEWPTLAERFRDRGYLTGGFVANMHYTAWDSGLPRGFARYEDYRVNWNQLVLSSSYTQTTLYNQLRRLREPAAIARAIFRPDLSIDPKHRFAVKRGNEVTDAFLQWHASSGGDRPFFAFLNYFDAHQPYYAPPTFRRFTGERGLDMYRAAIAFLDAELERLLVTLRERGALDNTLVVVTSDHGELFQFKGLSGHAHNLYLNTIRVPLLLRLPGRVPEGVRVSHPVSLRDLAATVMELAAPDAAALPGVSLSRTWSGLSEASPVLAEVTRAKNVSPRYPTARGNVQSLLDERWQLIRHEADDRIELYDYRADSLAEHDLAGTDSAAATLAALRQRLRELLRPTR